MTVTTMHRTTVKRKKNQEIISMKTLFQNWKGLISFANYVKINIHYEWNNLWYQRYSIFKRNTKDFALLFCMLWVVGVFINTCTNKLVNKNDFWVLLLENGRYFETSSIRVVAKCLILPQ